MIYDPLIDELAALPLEMLVHPVSEQTMDGQVACGCPFCKSNDSPHFIIHKNKRGGLYSRPVDHWHCTKTGRNGYGAIELYAAMTGRGAWWQHDKYSPQSFLCLGENLRVVCRDLCIKAHSDGRKSKEEVEAEVKAKWPQLFVSDYRSVAVRPQEDTTLDMKADFSPQDLNALGCAVWLKNGVECYGFDTSRDDSSWHFRPFMIQEDFKVYALSKVTLPAVNRHGEAVSEVIYSTPWNPLFVCLAVEEPDDNEDYKSFKHQGSIFRPAMNVPPMVFSNSDEDKFTKVSRWLAGDKVFTSAVAYRTSDTTGVARAISEVDPSETVATSRQVWVEEVSDTGKVSSSLQEIKIAEADRKVKSVIYFTSAQDAISAFYHLKALRFSYPHQFGSRHHHVCWPFGDVQFTSVHYNKMSRFAENIITLFPSDFHQVMRARAISCRYREVLRASLPESFKDKSQQFLQYLYFQHPNTVRDFFLAYKMTGNESFQNDHDLNRLFSSCITSALSSMPFERKEKRDKNGNVKEVYYTINPATLWEFMASAGYGRDVRLGEPDKIGRFVRLNGPFADELTPASVVQAAVENLKKYARQYNDSRMGGNDEYEQMVQAVLRANKEINEKTIASLPVLDLDYNGAYGENVEHFFYTNGALRITKNSLSVIPYENIRFNIERGELLPWNITLLKNLPFEISENPEYRKRKEAIQKKKDERDDLGRPLYGPQQIGQDESELNIWAQSHRWIVDWKGRTEADMWPALRVLRGFANEDWQREQQLIHEGRKFSSEEQMELDCRFANLLFCLGRLLWRHRESKSNCIPYLMENEVTLENRAEGGSGKSTFVHIFAGCAAHILDVDCRDLAMGRELAANLADYRHRVHRIVHWEDTQSTFDLSKLYNFATGGFSMRAMYHDRVTIPLSEAPGHVVSSNYPVSDLADSTMRRICLGGFSHRFAGANIMKNKAARYISDIMPDFNATNPERLSSSSRNQIAMICALAVQFVMRYDEKVDAQKKYMEQRALSQSLGDSFLRFARVFFASEHVYGTPQDLDSMLEEYKSVYAEASKNKSDSFSPKAFKRRILDYCETVNIIMNPEQLFKKSDGSILKKASETNYFAHQAWCTRRYFEGRDWDDDASISPKQIRELVRTEHAVYFFRRGKDVVPENNEVLMNMYQKFVASPDPMPVLNEDGTPVSLTDEEKERWRNYLDGKQRKRPSSSPQVVSSTNTAVSDSDMPF